MIVLKYEVICNRCHKTICTLNLGSLARDRRRLANYQVNDLTKGEVIQHKNKHFCSRKCQKEYALEAAANRREKHNAYAREYYAKHYAKTAQKL